MGRTGTGDACRDLAAREQVKLFETFLHAATFDEMPTAAESFVSPWPDENRDHDLLTLFRGLFNEISLSPYTDLVSKSFSFSLAVYMLDYVSYSSGVDIIGFLLRQNGRHLTAYDLITYHHRGEFSRRSLAQRALGEYLLRLDWPRLFSRHTQRIG